MRKQNIVIAAILFFGLTQTTGFAQKKNFTYGQLFKSEATQFNKPLPVIRGWVDDDNYIEQRKNEADTSKSELITVNIKTGKEAPYTGPEILMPERRESPSPMKGVINPTFSPDKKWVAYTKKDHNLYITEIATKKEIQVTTDGSDVILNGYASWVYFEEVLGRSSRYRAFWWSNDSKKIAYMHFNDSKVPVFPIYVIKDQHGYLEQQRYPKPGDYNPEVKIGIASVQDQKTVWADFNSKDDQYFGSPYWTPGGQFWVQCLNRGQDNFKLYNINLSTGAKNEVYDEKQSTWVDLDKSNKTTFLSSGKGFIIRSDKDGWDNLYLYDINGKLIKQVTNENFWSTSIVKTDEKNKTIFFRARKENSARFDFYKVGMDGKNLVRLSFGNYSHDQISLSPNGKYFITTYSNVSTPAAMAIVDMNGKIIREIANTKGSSFDEYNLPKTEMARVKSEDGLFDLPVIITYPVNFDPVKKYPILISVYGGPNAGRVYDRWIAPAGISQWWAQEGIIQVGMDNRSSGHFGKKGLNFIHRQLGKWEIEDYMTCGKWLRKQSWADTSKIAITGGSFGGYMTCMALTYGADVFTHGIANSSVTDWHFYDTHYTERFMDTPAENPDGYKNTSVMSYANKYKGLLRIVHGTSDDNVHMQNSLTLIDTLENLGKHFEAMVYPGERHGIGANVSTKGNHNRNEAYLFYYQYLLNKPMPKEFWEPSAKKGF